MKLSYTMLNFLGYMAEWEGYCEKREPEAMLSHFGAVAAVKNGLIREGTLEVQGVDDPKAHALGFGFATTYHGWRLTELGEKLAAIGRLMRQDADAYRGTPKALQYVAEVQAVLDKEAT